MDAQSILAPVVEVLTGLIDALAALNPGIDPLLWAVLVLAGFALLAAFTRRLIGLLITGAIIVIGVYIAWHLAGW